MPLSPWRLKLFTENRWLAYKAVSVWLQRDGRRLRTEEYEQHSLTGLWKAAWKFNPKTPNPRLPGKFVRFSTYAVRGCFTALYIAERAAVESDISQRRLLTHYAFRSRQYHAEHSRQAVHVFDDGAYVGSALGPVDGQDPATTAEQKDQARSVRDLVRRVLPRPLAGVMLLHLDGLNGREIGERIGRTKQAVAVRLKNARLILETEAGFLDQEDYL